MARIAAWSLPVAFLLALEATAPPAETPAIIFPRMSPEAAVSHMDAAMSSHSLSVHTRTGLGEMLEEIRALRGEIGARRRIVGEVTLSGSGWDEQLEAMEKQLKDLEDMLRALEAQEAQRNRVTVTVSHAELQAEIDRLRKAVRRIEGVESGRDMDISTSTPEDEEKKLIYNIPEKVVGDSPNDAGKSGGIGPARSSSSAGSSEGTGSTKGSAGADKGQQATADHQGGSAEASSAAGGVDPSTPSASSARDVDVDIEMPYGDLEPFGREDTAQELTEDSIRQSDQMVDQLERAEVAEEKRAVFRALTRLRGAAITSFDGIARSQTGNIDDYARDNQWRKAHPVHHLANEEADVSRWAFPESADF